jgi:hypothetical protein
VSFFNLMFVRCWLVLGTVGNSCVPCYAAVAKESSHTSLSHIHCVSCEEIYDVYRFNMISHACYLSALYRSNGLFAALYKREFDVAANFLHSWAFNELQMRISHSSLIVRQYKIMKPIKKWQNTRLSNSSPRKTLPPPVHPPRRTRCHSSLTDTRTRGSDVSGFAIYWFISQLFGRVVGGW